MDCNKKLMKTTNARWYIHIYIRFLGLRWWYRAGQPNSSLTYWMSFQQKIHQNSLHIICCIYHFDSKINNKQWKLTSEIYFPNGLRMLQKISGASRRRIMKHVPVKNPSNYMCTTKKREASESRRPFFLQDHQSFLYK